MTAMGSSRAIIDHPHFERGCAALMRALDTDMAGQLIFVVGVSGVGKSEIRYRCMRDFAGPSHSWGRGELPALSVRASPTDRSNFNEKEFMTRLFFELHEPNVAWLRERSRVDTPDSGLVRADHRLRSPLWTDIRASRTEHALRHSVELTARARKVRAIFVEEGASLTYTHRNKKPVDHMVNYMCFAEEIGISLVFFGVPKIAALWEGNGEVLRRSRFVWIDRYRLDLPQDRANFERLAISVAAHYPFSNMVLVRKTLDLAYASSAGVFGELDAFYRRSDDIRADRGETHISGAHLEQAISSDSSLQTLHDEAAAFDLLRTPASASTVKRMLGR